MFRSMVTCVRLARHHYYQPSCCLNAAQLGLNQIILSFKLMIKRVSHRPSWVNCVACISLAAFKLSEESLQAPRPHANHNTFYIK